jgi:CheY-like chemotaxis protein
MESHLILLAESDANDLRTFLSALDEMHLAHDTTVVRDGEEALDYLYSRGAFVSRPLGNPVVVFLGLTLPKVGGLDILQTLKSDPKLKSIPVVVFSSSRGEEDLTRGYEGGANAYIAKPRDPGAFARTIKDLATFWVNVNQAPPGSIERDKTSTAKRPPGDTTRELEKILVVSHEESVSDAIRAILASHGYIVLEAKDGPSALAISKNHSGPIHLLIADAAMPGMSGMELAAVVRSLRSAIRVLLISGDSHGSGIAGEKLFLQKPFTSVELLRKVREAIGARSSKST